jgi:hypothetical protein
MDDVLLVVDTGSSATLLEADDLDLGTRGGLRLSAARDIGFLGDLELEFFTVDQMSASKSIAAPGAEMVVYGATFGTSPLDVKYSSDLYGVEANWRQSWFDGRVKTLIGYRQMKLGEEMAVTDAASPPRLFQAELDNRLRGWQVGLEAALLRRDQLEIDAGVKYGEYRNSASLDAAFPQAGPGAGFDADGKEDARSREVWLGLNYHMTDSLALRLGYQAMWLDGIAVIPEQLDDLAVPLRGRMDMDGKVFYQGVNLGARFDW